MRDGELTIINPKDKEQICMLLTEFMPEMPRFLARIEGGLEAYAEKVSLYAKTFVAKEKNVSCGMAILYSNDLQDSTAYIPLIVVHREYQNRGIGSKLLDTCMQQAVLDGMRLLKLEVADENHLAQRFYVRHGFMELGRATENTMYMAVRLKEA